MGRTKEKKKKKKYLVLSLVINLGILFSFKYFNFFNDSLRELFNKFNLFYGIPEFKILLPVGISFYTFQSLSYVIDVYRGITEPAKHYGIYALYVTYFPQLVAGPIERSNHLLPQFYKSFDFDYKRFTDGLKLMAWGFFKKMVVADRLYLFVDPIFNNPSEYSGLSLLIAAYFFSFQIYCDFSGYSDIAVGAARMMGYDIMYNFNRPYFSRSIAEFWRRWHISLSTWFKDYVYFSLGGNRVNKYRHLFNLFITFVISGLWHGANWTYIIWGALHGLFLVIGSLCKGIKEKTVKFFRLDRLPVLHKYIQVFITFNLVTFALVVFRAKSMSDVFVIFKNMFSNWTLSSIKIPPSCEKFDFGFSFFVILIMEIIHKLQKNDEIPEFISKKPLLYRWVFYYLILTMVFIFGKYSSNQFIYFQF